VFLKNIKIFPRLLPKGKKVTLEKGKVLLFLSNHQGRYTAEVMDKFTGS
jgi:hypothetical protein